MNKLGYEGIDKVLKRGTTTLLSAEAFEAAGPMKPFALVLIRAIRMFSRD